MDDRTRAQLRMIHRAVDVLSAAGVPAWLTVPALRNGRPWRAEDVADIAVLRKLADEA
jgi:hypothetical protein